jgi:hypothetical protein
MTIDPMTKLVIATLALVAICLSAIVVIGADQINQGIVSSEIGFVVSKDLVVGSSSTVYSINIFNNNTSTNMTLYIFNDKTLYDSIIIDKTYSFSCLQSFKTKMELIQYATEVKTD